MLAMMVLGLFTGGRIEATEARETGMALRFDGMKEHATIPNRDSLNPLSAVTAEAWVKFERLCDQAWYCAEFILCKGRDSMVGSYRLYQSGLGGNHLLCFAVTPPSRYQDLQVIVTDLEAACWRHVCGTYDGDYLRLYLDGQLIGLKRIGRQTLGNDLPLFLGMNDVPNYRYFLAGSVDEVRVWSRARSAEEIKATMRAGVVQGDPGLVLWLRLNGMSEQVLLDSSCLGNDGYLGRTAAAEDDDPGFEPSGVGNRWPIPGDANLDCRVDILDLIAIRNAFGRNPNSGDNWSFDVNQDGAVNVVDLIMVRNRYGTKCLVCSAD